MRLALNLSFSLRARLGSLVFLLATRVAQWQVAHSHAHSILASRSQLAVFDVDKWIGILALGTLS
jgi:hypothetical protein